MPSPQVAPQVAMDTECKRGELDFPVAKPFGYCPLRKPFALVSESTGVIGHFDTIEESLPWCRMQLLRAMKGQRKRDLKLWQYDPELRLWSVAMRTINFREMDGPVKGPDTRLSNFKFPDRAGKEVAYA